MVQAYERKAKAEQRAEWERTRWLAFWSVTPHLGKDSKIKEPKDLMPFPWEGATKKQVITGAPLREMLDKYGKKSGS